jgi:hypothetical protein
VLQSQLPRLLRFVLGFPALFPCLPVPKLVRVVDLPRLPFLISSSLVSLQPTRFNTSLYASLRFCCLYLLFLSPFAMLCDICVGVIQHRRGLRSVRTRLDDGEGWYTRNLGDLENLGDNPAHVVGFEYSHHLTLGTLIDSVSAGCWICRSLWEDLSESGRDIMRNFDTTAENKGLTEMSIERTTGRGYRIAITVIKQAMGSRAYSLEPGQRLSYSVKTEFD